MILPVGEDADTVAARKDVIEVMFELREGKIFINHLCHLKGRLHVERDPCNNSQRAKSNDCARKLVA